jgi:hypothetical protein
VKEHRWQPGDLIVCETVAAITTHLRRLTAVGPKWGGAADTLALCGAKVSWDTRIPVEGAECSRCTEGAQRASALLDRAKGAR